MPASCFVFGSVTCSLIYSNTTSTRDNRHMVLHVLPRTPSTQQFPQHATPQFLHDFSLAQSAPQNGSSKCSSVYTKICFICSFIRMSLRMFLKISKHRNASHMLPRVLSGILIIPPLMLVSITLSMVLFILLKRRPLGLVRHKLVLRLRLPELEPDLRMLHCFRSSPSQAKIK